MQKQDEMSTPGITNFLTKRHNARPGYPDNLGHGPRSRTPQVGGESRQHDQALHTTGTLAVAQNGRQKFSVDELEELKFAMPKNPFEHGRSIQPVKQDATVMAAKPQKPNTSMKTQNPVRSRTNVFDDTTGIDSIYSEHSALEDNQTMVLRPQNFKNGTRGPTNTYVTDHEALIDDITRDGDILPDNWQQQVAEERAFREDTLQTGKPMSGTGSHRPVRTGNDNWNRDIHPGSKDDQEPETPTRTQSVPPTQPHVHGPVPRRQVGFVDNPHFNSDNIASPNVRSADLAREESPELPPRPKSARPAPQKIKDLQGSPPERPFSASRHLQNHVASVPLPGRFQKATEPRHQSKLQLQNILPPDFGPQPFSDGDNDLSPQQNRLTGANPFDRTNPPSVIGQKRSSDNLDTLDYPLEVLTNKTLSALQSEPYTTDPRLPAKQIPHDAHGNPMTLPQLLSNMKNMTPEAQRNIFLNQNDDEWAETGQWFINAFQADLQALVAVRLERRKIALKYESRIKQRQSEIKLHQEGVQKELKELQAGGTGLLKDRRPPGGSRSSTPMKGERK